MPRQRRRSFGHPPRRSSVATSPRSYLPSFSAESGSTQSTRGGASVPPLLKHFMLKAIEVAGTVGVRLVLVHAKDEEAKSFYRHYGFVESPVDPMTMMMLIGGV